MREFRGPRNHESGERARDVDRRLSNRRILSLGSTSERRNFIMTTTTTVIRLLWCTGQIFADQVCFSRRGSTPELHRHVRLQTYGRDGCGEVLFGRNPAIGPVSTSTVGTMQTDFNNRGLFTPGPPGPIPGGPNDSWTDDVPWRKSGRWFRPTARHEVRGYLASPPVSSDSSTHADRHLRICCSRWPWRKALPLHTVFPCGTPCCGRTQPVGNSVADPWVTLLGSRFWGRVDGSRFASAPMVWNWSAWRAICSRQCFLPAESAGSLPASRWGGRCFGVVLWARATRFGEEFSPLSGRRPTSGGGRAAMIDEIAYDPESVGLDCDARCPASRPS